MELPQSLALAAVRFLYRSVPTRADLEAEARAAQATPDDSDDYLNLETSLSEMSDRMDFPDPLIGRPPIEYQVSTDEAEAAYDGDDYSTLHL